MKNAKEVLNTIAANNGHKDWLELTHCEGPITILNCTIEAMELYAELSKSHIPVVGGPVNTNDIKKCELNFLNLPKGGN